MPEELAQRSDQQSNQGLLGHRPDQAVRKGVPAPTTNSVVPGLTKTDLNS